jgi:small multidrug resistance pump
MRWAALSTAIICEVSATLSFRSAVTGRPGFFAIVIVGYLAAFGGLAIALAQGMTLGVAYGIWAATGVAATAVLSKLIFDESLTKLMVAGIGLIIAGVLLVELGVH